MGIIHTLPGGQEPTRKRPALSPLHTAAFYRLKTTQKITSTTSSSLLILPKLFWGANVSTAPRPEGSRLSAGPVSCTGAAAEHPSSLALEAFSESTPNSRAQPGEVG